MQFNQLLENISDITLKTYYKKGLLNPFGLIFEDITVTAIDDDTIGVVIGVNVQVITRKEAFDYINAGGFSNK